jgi:hypothetical protein
VQAARALEGEPAVKRAPVSLALLGLVLSLAGACGAITGEASNQPRDPGNGSAPGGNNNPGPGGSSGPSGGGGNGSNIPPGGANPGGSPSPANPPSTMGPDAGAGGPAPPTTDPPPICAVSVVPVAPPRLLDLLAGPDARLRLQATVSGPAAPAQPTFTWKAMHDDAAPVAVSKVSAAGDAAEVPLPAPGRYRIDVSVTPTCTATVTATAASRDLRNVAYWVRLTPPRDKGSPAQEWPTQETLIQVGGSNLLTKVISLQRGDRVTIHPTDGEGYVIPSFVRVSSPQTSVRFEGNVMGASKFTADLDPRLFYDVLVVPNTSTQAPALIRGRRASELRAESFRLDDGVAVQGTVRAGPAPGAPQPGARVLLRAGALPSTIGTSAADGSYQLRARAGGFEVVVLPPAGSGLPEARLPAGDSLSIAGASVIGFRWNRPATVPLSVAVVDTAGKPIGQGASVRVEAEAELADVGVFDVELPTGPRSITAVGSLRLDGKTDTGGVAVFPAVAAGRYRVTVAPPPGATGAASLQTTVTAGAAGPHRLTLPLPVTLRGQLSPVSLTAGLRVLAIDEASMAPGEALTATVDATGAFSFAVTPARTYRLQIEPAQDRGVPRLFLGPTYVGTGDTTRAPLTLSPGIAFVGTITLDGGRVAGAVVQLFCTGAPPDCVDPGLPKLETARPLAETKTAADGRFQVQLPDPKLWDL